MKLTPTNVTAAFILLGISVALASPTPQDQPAPNSIVPARPSICLKICYPQSPQCPPEWHAEQLGNCWACCRDVHPDGEVASAGATVGAGAATGGAIGAGAATGGAIGAGAATGGAIGAGATTDGGADIGVTTAGTTDIGVTTAGATDTGATTNTGTGTGAST